MLHSEKMTIVRRGLALSASCALAFTLMGAMVTIPHSGATAAYQDEKKPKAELPTQSIRVSATAANPVFERDAFTVTSAAEVRRGQMLQTAGSINSYLQSTQSSFVIHDKNDGTVIYPVTMWHFVYEDNGYHTTNRPTHNGVDMPIDEGTDIYAVADGKVIEIGSGGEYGNFVVIQHTIGGYTVETLYAHQVKAPLVFKGDTVEKGQLIGNVGSTGKSTGNHLHFEVKVNGVSQDPASWLELNAIR